MSDYGEWASDDDEDYGWIYVEDHYDEVDDLVEHACPSPTLLPAPDVGWSYDPYAYFEDIEYLSDAYFDGETKTNNAGQKPSKRKRGASSASERATKKAKTVDKALKTNGSTSQNGWLGNLKDSQHILWRTLPGHDRDNIPTVKPGAKRKSGLKSFALLREWDKLKDDEPLQSASSKVSRATKIEKAPGQDADQNTDEYEPEDGLDLGDLASVAGLLEGETLEALKKQLEEKGLDPSALDVVLQDLLEGKEPEFEDDEEEDGDDEVAQQSGSSGIDKQRGTIVSDETNQEPPKPRNLVPSKDRKQRKMLSGGSSIVSEKAEERCAAAEASTRPSRRSQKASVVVPSDPDQAPPTKANQESATRRSKRTRGTDNEEARGQQQGAKRRRGLQST